MIMIMAIAIVVVTITGHDELHGISNDDKHDDNCDGHGIASMVLVMTTNMMTIAIDMVLPLYFLY